MALTKVQGLLDIAHEAGVGSLDFKACRTMFGIYLHILMWKDRCPPTSMTCDAATDTEAVAGEAASLYNADLGTSMVTEMTALAGGCG